LVKPPEKYFLLLRNNFHAKINFMKKSKIVAVVGRPNVGKSTLINRILGQRRSIVDDMPGVTRDRVYFDAVWRSREFVLVDTGGIVTNYEDEFVNNIFSQAKLAVDEADTVIFVVDAKSGLSPYDTDIANILRQSGKEVIIAANKVDSIEHIGDISEFYALGLGEPVAISALHGSGGVGDLLDIVTKDIEEKNDEDEAESAIKIAIAGKPNAGKSSILNNLLNENRAIVSPVSGTTRDSINSEIVYNGREFVLVDTAGIRKKSKVDFGVEAFAVDRAIRAIREADVTLLVIDATEGLTEQDKKIAQTVEEAGSALVVAFNKWDLIKNMQTHKLEAQIEREAPFLNYAKKIFISAKTGQRLNQIFECAQDAAAEREKRVSTGLLNKVVNEAIALNPPVSIKGRMPKIYYSTQVKAKPPSFVLFVNDKNLIKESYKRYLLKKLREAFGFFGTPIRVSFREKKVKGEK